MTLILRKCYRDGSSRNGFKYGKVGEKVICPDWKSISKCGNGLHGLKEGNGDWSLLQGDDWLIIEADEKDIVDIDENKCKFKKGIILFRGTSDDLEKSNFIKKMKIKDKSLAHWANRIGNKDYLINKVKTESAAITWSIINGDKDVMHKKIHSDEFLLLFCNKLPDSIYCETLLSKIKDLKVLRNLNPLCVENNKKFILSLIKSEKDALDLSWIISWARPSLIKHIKSEEGSIMWASDFYKDASFLRRNIKSEEGTIEWFNKVGYDKSLIKNIKSENYAFICMKKYGPNDYLLNLIKSEVFAVLCLSKGINNKKLIKKIKSKEALKAIEALKYY